MYEHKCTFFFMITFILLEVDFHYRWTNLRHSHVSQKPHNIRLPRSQFILFTNNRNKLPIKIQNSLKFPSIIINFSDAFQFLRFVDHCYNLWTDLRCEF